MQLPVFAFLNVLASDSIQVERLLATRDYSRAVDLLNQRTARLSEPQLLIPRQTRLDHWMHLGIALSGLGEFRKAQLAWEKALSIESNLAEPAGLTRDGKAVWTKAKSQVDNAQNYPLVMPENAHFFDHYVDGHLIRESISLKEGPHFFQIRCGNGGLQSLSVEWPGVVPWREMCGLPPVELLQSKNSALVRENQNAKWRLTGIGFLTAGSSLLVVAGGMHQMWLAPLHQEVRNARQYPADFNRATADDLTASFLEAQRWTTVTIVSGLSALAIGLVMQWPADDQQTSD